MYSLQEFSRSAVVPMLVLQNLKNQEFRLFWDKNWGKYGLKIPKIRKMDDAYSLKSSFGLVISSCINLMNKIFDHMTDFGLNMLGKFIQNQLNFGLSIDV